MATIQVINKSTKIMATSDLTTLAVTPTTSEQTETGKFGTVNVAAVTSSIDANIQAGNIKKDVTILGVTGTYELG